MNEVTKTYSIYTIFQIDNGGYDKAEHQFLLIDDSHTTKDSAIRWIETNGDIADNYVIKPVYSVVPTYHF